MGNRKKAESYILKKIGEHCKGDQFNIDRYKKLFKRLSDKEFEEYMKRLATGDIYLELVVEHEGNFAMDVEHNFKMMESMGRSFHERLIYGESGSKADGTYRPAYKTPNTYLVVDMPYRRTAQLVSKKIAIPKNNHTVDMLTGQVTGESKAASLSMNEAQMLLAMGLYKTVEELEKVRGGDMGAARAYEESIARTGQASLESVKRFGTGTTSTQTLKNYLLAAHLKNTL